MFFQRKEKRSRNEDEGDFLGFKNMLYFSQWKVGKLKGKGA